MARLYRDMAACPQLHSLHVHRGQENQHHEGSAAGQRTNCVASPSWKSLIENGDDAGQKFVSVGAQNQQEAEGLGGGDDWLAHTAGEGTVADGIL